MNKIKYILLTSILIIFFAFGFKNVKAENETAIYEIEVKDEFVFEYLEFIDQFVDFEEKDGPYDGFIYYGLNENIISFYSPDVIGNVGTSEFSVIYYESYLEGIYIEIETDENYYMYSLYDDDDVAIIGFNLGDTIIVEYIVPPAEPFISHFTKIFDFLITPFTDILERLGIENTPISVGFGEVEWFNIALYDLTYLTLSFTVLYLFFRLIYKIIKVFVRIVTGGVL